MTGDHYISSQRQTKIGFMLRNFIRHMRLDEHLCFTRTIYVCFFYDALTMTSMNCFDVTKRWFSNLACVGTLMIIIYIDYFSYIRLCSEYRKRLVKKFSLLVLFVINALYSFLSQIWVFHMGIYVLYTIIQFNLTSESTKVPIEDSNHFQLYTYQNNPLGELGKQLLAPSRGYKYLKSTFK